MFLDFFLLLKKEGLPVSIKEYLDLLEALDKKVIAYSLDEFYYLCKTVLNKNEVYLDRFDILFGQYFKGASFIDEIDISGIPKEWLEKEIDRIFSAEEKALIEKLGGIDALMKRFEELLNQQKEKHQGGNTWIGTGGTSPFGHGGYNPEGFRVGGSGGQMSAVKVWEKREFRNYASDVELNTRNIKMAMKRLRILTREGLEEELDLDGTIDKTCRNAGFLDIEMQASKKNRVKVILLMDSGGSMDPNIELVSQLFSAARSEFKHLEYYYFHNCIYESLWKDNQLRWSDRIPTFEVLHKYNNDYRVIIVGDATMSPHEIISAGGSVEHYNDESGATWLQRIKDHFPYLVWLNPTNEYYWKNIYSLNWLKDFFGGNMFPMTLDGLSNAMNTLKGKKLRA
ncbi:MAG: hypothetical protein K1X55_15970 [Chitinophagales bacterium]|nr:hypothetical protein [Chitinophagales bacterium]